MRLLFVGVQSQRNTPPSAQALELFRRIASANLTLLERLGRASDVRRLAASWRVAPNTATLQAVADNLEHTIAHGQPEQAKALLAILVAELRVNSRAEALPTYRLDAPAVCAPTSSVEPTGIEPEPPAP